MNGLGIASLLARVSSPRGRQRARIHWEKEAILNHIRVLWVIKGLGPGGAEQLLVQAARAGDHERFDYHAAFAVADKEQFVPALQASHVTVHPLAEPTDRGPRWLVRLHRLIRTGRFQVVHTHSPLLAGIIRPLVRLMPLSSRPALIYTEHNRWGQYRRPTRWLNRLTYPLDGTILAVSEGVRETVTPRLRGAVSTLHHGIDLDHVRRHAVHRRDARNELGIPDDQILIGIVANLRREKAYEDLLLAATEVIESHPNVQFVSVGQGPLDAELKRRHHGLGLQERFRFLGFREDVLRLLSAFDIFTLSSHHEGLPVAVMEAQALGIPIVATSVGGLPEVISDGVDGLLVPPAQPSRLAEALGRLADDAKLRARMAAAARERAGRFDGVRAVQAIEDHYVEAVESRRRGTR